MAAEKKEERQTEIQRKEDRVKSEISELYLLLKSGKLSESERLTLKARLDDLIQVVKREQEKACCRPV